MSTKKKTDQNLQEYKERLLIRDLKETEDDRMFFANGSDNTESFIKSLLSNPNNNQKALLPSDNFQIIDGKLAIGLQTFKMVVVIFSKVFYSNDLQREVEAEATLKVLEPSIFESFERAKAWDSPNLKVTVIHNPQKQGKLVTGETIAYELKNETKTVEVWNGTRMNTKTVLEKNEYLLIS